MLKKIFNKTNIILFFILVLASFLRLYRISEYMTFLGDEGRDVLVVKHILEGKFTLLGPTASVGGFFLGPIYYYFMAPFLFLFRFNPVGPAVMVAFFGIATVWLIYKAGSEFFSDTVGILAAFLYSISPIIISYSRSSWNPNPLPFFSLLTIYLVFLATKNNKLSYFFIAGILLGIALQLHYLTVFLGLIIFVYVLLERFFYQKTNLILQLVKDYFYLFFGFIFGWLPFLAFEIRHGFPNIRSIFKFIFFSQETGASGRFFSIINDVFFRIFARIVTNFPPPEQINIKMDFSLFLWYYFILILAIASLIYLIISFFKYSKNPKARSYLLLFLWLALGVITFGFYRKPIYDYYFGFMFPAPFLVISLFLVSLWNRNIFLKILALFVFILLVFLNQRGIPFRFAPNRQLDQVKKISAFVFSQAKDAPFNFALITGGNSDHAYKYFLELWGNPPVTIQNFDIDPKRQSVTKNLFIVCESIPCFPLGNSLWEIAGFGRAEIAEEWSVSVVKVYKLIHYQGI